MLERDDEMQMTEEYKNRVTERKARLSQCAAIRNSILHLTNEENVCLTALETGQGFNYNNTWGKDNVSAIKPVLLKIGLGINPFYAFEYIYKYTYSVELNKVVDDLKGILSDVYNIPENITWDAHCMSWNNHTPDMLATEIYDSRAFEKLPVLADTLEEGGCVDHAILEHFRSSNKHYLGCWALDLILGFQ